MGVPLIIQPTCMLVSSRKIFKNFENNLTERGYPAAIVRKYPSEVKFADKKTAP